MTTKNPNKVFKIYINQSIKLMKLISALLTIKKQEISTELHVRTENKKVSVGETI
jgi:hypothetical protein